ncbi:uncharacterized protein LOC115731731 isoform X2 [Rhodamnia argentea]|uniref:Uncharacterized protein LOC115731731 isoform X2 n=1 Tax=Rhodamnia argentea TaxID=178133 RepID=A0ABM3HEB6_9MYRT|nr:uncharacterized protein LOC115731731 isoform X2 [Rhodamnia argentea]
MKEPSNSTPPEISNSRRFYPYFKDCIGAIDGTHVRASVPLEIQGRFRGRKDGTTQNVLAAVTFDLRFSYVLAGWEGTAHDSRVLADALSKPDGLNIPRVIMKGKGKANDEKVKQFRWSKPMERVLLEILADEASKGNKPSSIFKPSSIARVVDTINERFGVVVNPTTSRTI